MRTCDRTLLVDRRPQSPQCRPLPHSFGRAGDRLRRRCPERSLQPPPFPAQPPPAGGCTCRKENCLRMGGRGLGGGRPDLAGLCRPDGRPDWERVRASEAFRAALGRLAGRARREPTAIMCAEEDPQRCHRLHLVCAAWVSRYGGKIFHIRGNGRIELEKRVAGQLKLF